MTVGERERVSISATEADWSREQKSWRTWNPSRSLLASMRDWEHAWRLPWPLRWIVQKRAVLAHRFWSVVTGTDIPINTRIGGGLSMPHPNGVVIHPDAVIGVNCMLFQQVTIGSAGGGVPRIGGHVDIGAGAKVIGAVTIGDHAVIGANAVVTKDVPAGTTAVGVPAVIVRGAKNPDELSNSLSSQSADGV